MTSFVLQATDSRPSGYPGKIATLPLTLNTLVPPTLAQCSLSLRGQGADAGTVMTDDTGITWTRTGVTTSTAQSKFGGSALKFVAGQLLSRPRTDGRFDFGTGDFTIEAFVFQTSNTVASQFASIFSDRASGGDFNTQLWLSTGRLTFTYGTAADLRIDVGGSASAQIALNTWNHVAVTKRSGLILLFVNGIIVASTTDLSAIRAAAATIYIGMSDGFTDSEFAGYMHVRVLKGVALYTRAFVPPLNFPVPV